MIHNYNVITQVNSINSNMNNNAWIIWNTLLETDYKIDNLIINIDYHTLNIHINCLEIKIKFENNKTLEKFSNYVFTQYGIYINVDTYDNSFEIELKNTNSNYQTKKNLLENLLFPPNINSIEITNGFNICTENSYTLTKLFNLPENLSQLKISSTKMLFDLSNLPTNLILLDISECILKLNLDYLPYGLKILYLEKLFVIKKQDFYYSYNLKDLSNLPTSLIEIHFRNVIFKSTTDLIKTFDK